ncbi:MAG: hypothetical protein H7Z11_12465 [Verrucomicrobia bacterium]|nr:hypothetical protein [Leptolyngbya sp. ES-bin-22]
MKLNSTVALTLILLVSMVVAGLVSASWGSSLGREALKGITQPDTRPESNKAGSQAGNSRREELAVLPENDIIANVKVRMNGGSKDTNTSPSASAKAAPTTEVATETAKTQLPMTATSQDVALEVKSVRRQGESLVLAVSLRNSGKQPVRFVYDALTVTDEQGRSLKATTDGLPVELPASSNTFAGTVSIPASLLDGVQKISLSLTDYPDKRLQLQLSNIPLVQ